VSCLIALITVSSAQGTPLFDTRDCKEEGQWCGWGGTVCCEDSQCISYKCVAPEVTADETDSPTPSPSVGFTMAPAYSGIIPCRVLDPDSFYWCPATRYCEWNTLPTVQDHLRRDLSYIKFEWDYLIAPATTDETSFSDLTHITRESLKGLGYDEDRHDCCNSHFSEYAWSDFTEFDGYYAETLAALETLGYNETSWDESYVNENDDKWWNELSQAEQYAAYDGLCYNRELWNEFPLSMWDDVEDLPGSYFYSELDASDWDDDEFNPPNEPELIVPVITGALSEDHGDEPEDWFDRL